MEISSSSHDSMDNSRHKWKHTGGLEFERALQRYYKQLMSAKNQPSAASDVQLQREIHAEGEGRNQSSSAPYHM